MSGLSTIYDIAFDTVTGDMLAVSKAEKLVRVNMTTHAFTTGWSGLDLTKFGMKDTRGVEVIGEQVFVSDGYDFRSSSDPMNHAIFVFDVTGPGSTPAPTASFTASADERDRAAERAVHRHEHRRAHELGVDASVTAARRRVSRRRTPYTAAGTFTATADRDERGGSTLGVAARSRSARRRSAPTASFTASPTSGTAPLNVQFTDTSTGAPTSWAWDFGDGGTSTSQSPSHTLHRERHVHRAR